MTSNYFDIVSTLRLPTFNFSIPEGEARRVEDRGPKPGPRGLIIIITEIFKVA